MAEDATDGVRIGLEELVRKMFLRICTLEEHARELEARLRTVERATPWKNPKSRLSSPPVHYPLPMEEEVLRLAEEARKLREKDWGT